MSNTAKKINSDIQTEKTQNELIEELKALHKVQAVIEFNLDGTIRYANDNFLKTLGYSLEEIQGQHHKIFCESSYANSLEYKQFWQKLGRGEFESAEYRRVAKDGREVWINASYNPILDESGKPWKVIKFATDITQSKLKNADYEGKVTAIGRAQAVIEFNLDGTIISANNNFLNTLEYSIEEVQGKHHKIFCEPEYTKSNEYKEFWAKLGRGEFETAEYKRLSKSGKEIWINASYNPIFDMNGRPFKVVKFATDVTASKVKNAEYEGKINAINKAQGAIEFNLDGTIINANENFLNAMGYQASELQGKHHRMFCEPEYARSQEYKDFWAKLNRGEFDTGRYMRFGAGGKKIWIQATYNPILNANQKK